MLKKLIGVIASQYSTELYELVYENLVSLIHSQTFSSFNEFLEVLKPSYDNGFLFCPIYEDIDDKIREILTTILIDEKTD